MFCYLPQSFTSSEWYIYKSVNILCSYCVMCHLYDMVGNLLMFVNVLTDVRDTADRIPELLVGYRVGLYLCSVLLQLLAKPHCWKWLTMFSFLKSVCVWYMWSITHTEKGYTHESAPSLVNVIRFYRHVTCAGTRVQHMQVCELHKQQRCAKVQYRAMIEYNDRAQSKADLLVNISMALILHFVTEHKY